MEDLHLVLKFITVFCSLTFILLAIFLAIVSSEIRSLYVSVKKMHKKLDTLIDCISSYDEEDAKKTAELNETTLEVFQMLKEKYSDQHG